ncbi:hypothetical protein BpHYR1_047573 [Brachionus plicatilis]|uniref:Uncharacterized protein n=1 Tax=Brachionus plicatilis TaxID=10195 RepID=A0A3M7SRZ9_BRAPC|nr:hypothetical protein BpHYR1_047573 [Brachionus plicatilis]
MIFKLIIRLTLSIDIRFDSSVLKITREKNIIGCIKSVFHVVNEIYPDYHERKYQNILFTFPRFYANFQKSANISIKSYSRFNFSDKIDSSIYLGDNYLNRIWINLRKNIGFISYLKRNMIKHKIKQIFFFLIDL